MKVVQSRPGAIALVLFIATLLAARPMGLGLDDHNYLEYFNSAEEILSRYDGVSVVMNEPLWLLVCYGANVVFGSEGSLRFIIFASSVFAGIGLARINRWELMPVVLYFALPVSLKNHVDHLRQGYALGVYLLLFSLGGHWRVLRFATPLVHASFWVVIVIDVLLAWYYKRHPERTRVDALKVLLVSAGVSMALSFGLAQVAAALGFRQADVYDFMASEGSGVAFFLWLALLPMLFVLANRRCFGPFAAFLGFYLGGYYFSPVAARIFENSYFLLCSSAPTDSRERRFLFWAMLITMGIAFAFTGNLYLRLLTLEAAPS